MESHEPRQKWPGGQDVRLPGEAHHAGWQCFQKDAARSGTRGRSMEDLPHGDEFLPLPNARQVCWMVNSYPFVAIKMARRQGARRERYRCVSQPRSNAGAGPFSSQPSGPGDFWRFSALLARAVSQRILPLRSRLEKRQNSLRQMHRYLLSSTLEVPPAAMRAFPSDKSYSEAVSSGLSRRSKRLRRVARVIPSSLAALT